MNEKLNSYQKLEKIFKSRGFNLYLVGGTVRDFLLNIPLTDMDLAVDATPDELIQIIPECDSAFIKYGSVKYYFDNVKFDITCLRKEEDYLDYRHPSKVTYVKDIKLDYIRRDFSINAMYMDGELNLYDFCNGKVDLENKIIRLIGEPNVRIKEDPLRILRAIRFAYLYDFSFDNSTYKAMKNNINLLDNISKDKIKMEMLKFKPISNLEKLVNLFNDFAINQYIDMIE